MAVPSCAHHGCSSSGLAATARAVLGAFALLGLAAAAGCGPADPAPAELPPPSGQPRSPLDTFDAAGPLVVAHGGQGSPASRSDGPAAAAEATWAALASGEATRAAVVAGMHVLEDDPRYNAGTGANLRLDGRTIQCDAAIMDDDHGFGAVAGLASTRHPIDVAAAVADGPHLLVAGDGANALAERLGAEQRALDTDGARAKLRRGWRRLLGKDGASAAWADFSWRSQWNFDADIPSDMAGVDALLAAPTNTPASDLHETRDTVGIVARDAEGRFVAALSTGGTTLALRGRVGDVPQLGHGLYAGPDGAVAATGKGEAIIRERVALEVYRGLANGLAPDEAIRLGMRGISADEGVGVIAVSRRGWGARATSQMAWAVREEAGVTRADDVVRTDRW